MSTIRTIGVIAYDESEILDVTGPVSVFANASHALGARGGYRVHVLARERGAVRTSSGVALMADRALARAPREIDTLIVPGGEGTRAACADAVLIEQLRRLATRARRVASVCSGAFLLAQAGLLDGRRATTHWAYADQLQRAFPAVRVEPDAIFVRDEPYWTSAGVTAGLDLALALVEADWGNELALTLARHLVFYVKRPGGQSQYSVPLATQQATRPALERLRQHVIEHPQADLSLGALAARAHVSERHLRRLFQRELALTPREFVQRARLEQAQRLLSESPASLRDIARRCGYGSADALARRFEARFGVSPSAWRERFRRA